MATMDHCFCAARYLRNCRTHCLWTWLSTLVRSGRQTTFAITHRYIFSDVFLSLNIWPRYTARITSLRQHNGMREVWLLRLSPHSAKAQCKNAIIKIRLYNFIVKCFLVSGRPSFLSTNPRHLLVQSSGRNPTWSKCSLVPCELRSSAVHSALLQFTRKVT
jgi:hypothetical protein